MAQYIKGKDLMSRDSIHIEPIARSAMTNGVQRVQNQLKWSSYRETTRERRLECGGMTYGAAEANGRLTEAAVERAHMAERGPTVGTRPSADACGRAGVDPTSVWPASNRRPKPHFLLPVHDGLASVIVDHGSP